MAFMAYVNNSETPTEVEFQYYRSVSSHSASQQGDQVFVYKLTKTAGWSVTTRESSTKIVAGANMSSSYNAGTLTINGNYSAFSGANGSTAGTFGLVPAPAANENKKYLRGDGTWARDEWELIGEFSVAEDSDHVDFLTDSNGQAFSVREMFVQAWLPQATTQKNDYVASKGLCWASGGVAAVVGSPTNRYMANGAATYMEYKMELICGNVYTIARSSSSTANSQTPQSTTSDQNDIVGIGGFRLQQYNATSTLIPSGTRVKIFGIRI
jgi:hypothetical protein